MKREGAVGTRFRELAHDVTVPRRGSQVHRPASVQRIGLVQAMPVSLGTLDQTPKPLSCCTGLKRGAGHVRLRSSLRRALFLFLALLLRPLRTSSCSGATAGGKVAPSAPATSACMTRRLVCFARPMICSRMCLHQCLCQGKVAARRGGGGRVLSR